MNKLTKEQLQMKLLEDLAKFILKEEYKDLTAIEKLGAMTHVSITFSNMNLEVGVSIDE